MRRLIAALLCCGSALAAPPPKSVAHFSVKSAPAKPVKAMTRFAVVIAAEIEPGWHLYALEEPADGPVATEVSLAEGDAAQVLKVTEGKPKVINDPVFGKPTGFFEGQAEFTLGLQVPRGTRPGASSLHVLVRYQSCNDKVCLPPHTDVVEVPFAVAP